MPRIDRMQETPQHPAFRPYISGEQIKMLRTERKESLAEFAWTLKRAVDPKAEKPFSRQYIDQLERGQTKITPEVQAAFIELSNQSEQIAPGLAGAVGIMVRARPGQIPPNTYIPYDLEARACKNPLCDVVFLPKTPFQLYHHPDCKEAAHQYEREQRRKAKAEQRKRKW